ncbi:MAG: response regulator transcription factor [Chloroflexi bacterium]|nr:response regulator transcription factor [Chloroflexota bacterium]
MKTTVSIVEDFDDYRRHLQALIGGSDGFACAGVHATAEEALKKVPLERPDVLLLDLHLPGASGLECITPLKSLLPKIEIVVLTIEDNPKKIFAALEAGATGYLVKPVNPAKLLECLTEARRGGAPMSPQIARQVLQALQRIQGAQKSLAMLTARHVQIVELLAEGLSNKEIADKLVLAEGTVSTHIHNIYERLHVHSRAAAVNAYLRGRRAGEV